MSITIKDVAREAGVSPSTVSRVISDDRSISDKTKEKVREVMAQLKYYPNLNARRLVSKRSNVIGLVLPNNSDNFYQNPFFPTVLRGINEVSNNAQYSLLLYTGNSEEERLDHVKQLVYGKQVDGLVFLYYRQNDKIVEFLQELDFPFVVIGSPMQRNIPFVDNDNELIARQATNYLLTIGARKIAFVGGDLSQAFVQLRFSGYQKALDGFGLPIQEELIFNNVEFLSTSGYEITEKLATINNLDGIIIADQLVARGIKDRWRQLGKKPIPMITFKAFNSRDSLQHSEVFVDINARELGQRALEILLEIIRQQDTKEDAPVSHQETVEAKLVT